nr:immunoglobulin light chain junction region [Macaca mulatta]MPO06828.1 immunoglobulin light chain junction region [Macaca mulatta]MPO06908.1 immunoglobulin light chain junction region [Macaca mulatta]MPO07463.1 immunoglobulin light chain junction region [Macaca mulatta]MPO08849.1 immunoglobulin light chain junction region [Macaca mulatta]
CAAWDDSLRVYIF